VAIQVVQMNQLTNSTDGTGSGTTSPLAAQHYHDLKLGEVPESDSWVPFSEGYDDKVFSFTSFRKNREIILDLLIPNRNSIDPVRILNMGTGPTPYLNRDLLALNASIVATDFCQAMLDNAAKDLTHERLQYSTADSKGLILPPTFDNVLAINSILPSCREDVVSMFASALRVLKPGGRFIATLMPHDNVLYMTRYITNNWQIVDSENKIEIDTNGRQCNHDPETLYSEMLSAGWDKGTFAIKVLYLDSSDECAEIERLYNYSTGAISPVTGKTLPPWYQLLLVADKPLDKS
jgi:SAM-dependent methyltransferase